MDARLDDIQVVYEPKISSSVARVATHLKHKCSVE